ncbi:hypothetical protein [Nonomuraea sp. NPDC049784]|uniref:hypothetical protein n=1 Tax=Nonomuraea sp. NPDC049784 TaxID=3154361 RepID=UPI0033DD2623
MRSHKLIAGLALAAGLAAPAVLAVTPAHATAASCRVDLYKIVANNVAERDGKDELRFKVDGNLFPKFGDKYHVMKSGDTAYATAFGNPTTLLVVGSGNKLFGLREVTPPFVSDGDPLGSATAHESTCKGLSAGQHADDPTIITGTDETAYTYTVTLRLTRQ